MKKKVRKNLKKLFVKNYVLIKDTSIKELFTDLVVNNPEAYNLDLRVTTKLFSNKEIKRFEAAINNDKLIALFEAAKSLNDFDDDIIRGLKIDVEKSMELVKNKVKEKNKKHENQIIFLEHDDLKIAYLCGFGKQEEMPILEKPEYFKYDYKEELYNGIGKIDYTKLWKNVISFKDLLDELELIDQVEFSEKYQALINSYKFKTYLLLFEVFEQLGVGLFEGISIKKPLYIYGNEHDCEAINIYIYE